MGKPCVTSVRDMSLTLQGEATVLTSSAASGEGGGGDLQVVHSGEVITLDGSSGRILPALQPTVSLAQVQEPSVAIHFEVLPESIAFICDVSVVGCGFSDSAGLGRQISEAAR